MLYASAWQTVGPFLHIGMAWLDTGRLAGEGVFGERIAIEGRLVDGHGAAVPDGLVEIWQANAHGRYSHPEDRGEAPLEPGFLGFGRLPTEADGGFRFDTIKPGRVAGADGRLQAPHVMVSVFARGVLKRLATRIYFDDEAAANADDPVLARVPEARRSTLIARRVDDRPGTYRYNIVIQGRWLDQGETVFFDI